MAEQELTAPVAQGVQAPRDGGEVAKKAIAETQDDASSPELTAALADRRADDGSGSDDSDDRGQEEARQSLTGALPSE